MARLTKFGAFAAVLAVAALFYKFVFAYLADSIFAPPIVAVSAWIGPWPAFMIAMPITVVIGYLLAILTVRGIDHQAQSNVVRFLVRWVRREGKEDTGRAVQRWWSHGPVTQAIGLLVSGIILGPILTTGLWRLRQADSTADEVRCVAVLSAVVFAPPFAALYAFVPELVKHLF